MTNQRPIVVLATDSTVPSGVGEHMLTLGGALRATHDVVLAFPANSDGIRFLARANEDRFETHALGEDDQFASWLAARRPDIVHVHAGIGWEGHPLVEAGRNARIPVLRTEHLPYLITDPEQQVKYRRVADLAHAVIVVSSASAESYRENGFPHVVTICNGIETPAPRRSRRQTRAALAIADDVPLGLSVARFAAQKGHDCLLRAAAEAARSMPGLHILLVGQGPEMAQMQSFAGVLKLRNVTFLGQRADVPDLMAAADLLVLPSLFEGLPLVVLEAMALGLPVVATRVGGTVEALGEDHPYLVPANNPVRLAAVIEAALTDADGLRRVGLRAKKRFDERFTAERMGRETAALYRSIRREACAA